MFATLPAISGTFPEPGVKDANVLIRDANDWVRELASGVAIFGVGTIFCMVKANQAERRRRWTTTISCGAVGAFPTCELIFPHGRGQGLDRRNELFGRVRSCAS